MSERELFDEISRLNGIFFSNTDPAHYEKDCYLMFLEGLKSAESELAALKEDREDWRIIAAERSYAIARLTIECEELQEENERLIKECNTWVNQYDCARVENEAAIVKINELSNVLWKLINCGALSEEAKFTSIDGSMKILSDVLGEI